MSTEKRCARRYLNRMAQQTLELGWPAPWWDENHPYDEVVGEWARIGVDITRPGTPIIPYEGSEMQKLVREFSEHRRTCPGCIRCVPRFRLRTVTS